MRFLSRERNAFEKFLPGLDNRLSEIPLQKLESPESPAIGMFRDACGSALVIPKTLSGLGATPVEALLVQRAIASRSPSLAVATTMHHFSVATLVELAARSAGLEGLLLAAIASQKLIVASGFAEGHSGRGILAPSVEARQIESGYLVSGSKKPCSLSRSMDLLTISASVSVKDCCNDFAVMLIPANSPGIERRSFWNSWILDGAESDEVVLESVMVPDNLVFRANGMQLDAIQIAGFLWFELLISASYIGIASALVERLITTRRGSPTDRATAVTELEAAMSALETVARSLEIGQKGEDVLARSLFVRFATENAIGRAASLACELLGGMAYITSNEVSYLLAATRALTFHPPSRTSASHMLLDYLEGKTLTIQ